MVTRLRNFVIVLNRLIVTYGQRMTHMKCGMIISVPMQFGKQRAYVGPVTCGLCYSHTEAGIHI